MINQFNRMLLPLLNNNMLLNSHLLDKKKHLKRYKEKITKKHNKFFMEITIRVGKIL